MPSHTPKERAKKKGSSHNSNGKRKGIKVSIEIKPVKGKPKKR